MLDFSNLPELPQIKQWQSEAHKANKILLLLIAGDSASGKSTRGANLGLSKIITSTSRQPRNNEVDGRDYYFLDAVDFGETDDFIEQTIYANQNYGTTKKELETKINSHKDCYIITDVAGILNIKNEIKINWEDKVLLKSIYYTISQDTFNNRIKHRGDNSPISIKLRMEENNQAHKHLQRDKNLVDLIIDADKDLTKNYEK